MGRYGLTPAQYPDFAALRGDPSDNLPSIPTVGEKTAIKWIAGYGSLTELIRHADDVKGRVGDALREHIGQVETNRMLTELVADVPLAISLEDTERQPFERAEIHEVFDALQFPGAARSALRDAAGGGGRREAPGHRARRARALGAHRRSRRGRCVAACSGRIPGRRGGQGHVGCGHRGDRRAGPVRGRRRPLVLDTSEPLPAEDAAALRDWFADHAVGKVLHDSNGPLLALAARGWPLTGLAGDTALAAYVVLPGQRTFDLVDLVPRFLHRDLPAVTAEPDGQLSLDGIVEAQALNKSASTLGPSTTCTTCC